MIHVKLLNQALWDRIGWDGVQFTADPSGKNPPCMVLLCRNPGAARTAFVELREIIGAEDPQDHLRISIIEGDLPGQVNPGYTVIIGPNMKRAIPLAGAKAGDALEAEIRVYFASIRVAIGGPALPLFKFGMGKHGRCLVFPMGMNEPFLPDRDRGIWKTGIVFRRVERIARDASDQDSIIFVP